ncbi:MAG TPA: lyase family protein [Candidatus Paceibacterota bacterium]|nr:lyase family protein [Candidatus Paceibacterota bacterium]HPT18398.1 lyase family protein [Candidatus Paceibacterota bacterium]
MIERYANKEIKQIFADTNKTFFWQEMELAVIKAEEELGYIPAGTHEKISRVWHEKTTDLEWWKNKDEEIHHDLNAFILERVRHLPLKLQKYVHNKITSYDTEETPFLQMLYQACEIIDGKLTIYQKTLINFARKNRYTVMIGRTHGQEAELKSLGARALSWQADLRVARKSFSDAVVGKLFLSKVSGAVGNYGSISPEVEKRALEILGFNPFYGSTQILPRVLHAPVAQALLNMILVLDKIANDVRLNARSGRPLLQEPFKKKQTGSSAMPHKKNPIQLEQIEGLARLAKGYTLAITENIKTWEERSIEQSSVERVAWPDLFHVVARALDVINKVFTNLTVYRGNMLQEIIDSRGVYASSEVKEFLKKHLSEKANLDYEGCYRLVQLACFNAFDEVNTFDPEDEAPKSFQEAESLLCEKRKNPPKSPISIEEIILTGKLRPNSQLQQANQNNVDEYNKILKDLFQDPEIEKKWHEIFKPSFLLKNEAILFKEIIEQ